ncbi:MAG: ABC transporter permease subunit [Woeseiaceae bacterium]
MTDGSRPGIIAGPVAEMTWTSRVRAYFLKHEWLRGYALLSPTLLVMICALALPILTLVVYSFWTQDYVHIDKTATLNNYETFFDKWIYGKLLLRSIRMSATVTLITILLAYPVAYFLAFRVKKNIMTWLILINLPLWTSYLLRVLAWKIMLGNNGVINSTLLGLEIIQGPLEFLLYSRFAVILTLVHGWAAFTILPIYLSLSKIDRSLLETAADLGESPIRTFLRVTLPLSMPGVIAAAVIQFIPTVGEYVIPMMVGGPRGMMFGQIIAAQFGEANNWPMGAALTIIMMITITAVALTFIWLAQRGTVKRREMETVLVPNESAITARRRFSPLFFYVVLYLMFLYIPSLILPIFSFNDSIQMALPLQDFTVRWYLEIPTRPGLLEALGNSFKLAIPVAIVSTTLATIAAKALTRYRFPGQGLATGFILLPMVMPGIILAFGLLVLALAVSVPLSLWTIGVAHVVFTVPFSTLVVRARLEGFGKSLEESAQDLGENAWMTFWRVTFPLILPGVGACLLLSFIASFDEFVFALFLGGNHVTLPVFMWTQVRFPQTLPTILALGTCIIMGSVVLLGTAEWLRRMGAQQTKNIA